LQKGLKTCGKNLAKIPPDVPKPGNIGIIPGAAREGVAGRDCRADCPDCQPMAFMLFSSYIRKE
jgi:hypothetical protein